MTYDLAIVMPVYNEQECIGSVVRSWLDVLSALGAQSRMIVLNDGSKDATAGVLAGFSGDGRIQIVNKPNSGHGPTVLAGYRMAVALADWVFQCDSDDEMRPAHFPSLWRMRQDFDAVFGVRTGRRQGLGRKLISAASRATVRMLFGRAVRDVNVPYRLMRSECLKPIVEQIPPDTFAPNVIVAGAFARAGLRIGNVPVPHQGRRTGAASIVRWRLWKSALRSFRQTLLCRPVVQKRP